jgi:hypothetical protein
MGDELHGSPGNGEHAPARKEMLEPTDDRLGDYRTLWRWVGGPGLHGEARLRLAPFPVSQGTICL